MEKEIATERTNEEFDAEHEDISRTDAEIAAENDATEEEWARRIEQTR
jgi:hypothetical protein